MISCSTVWVIALPKASPSCFSDRLSRHRTTAGSRPWARMHSWIVRLRFKPVMNARVLACAVLASVKHGKQFLMLPGLLGDAATSTAMYFFHMSMPFLAHFVSATCKFRFDTAFMAVAATGVEMFPFRRVFRMLLRLVVPPGTGNLKRRGLLFSVALFRTATMKTRSRF